MKAPKKVRSKKVLISNQGNAKKLLRALFPSHPKFKRNIITLALPILGLACYLGINSVSNSIQSWQNSSIPNKVKVDSSNQEAFRIATEIATQELAKTQKQRVSRSTILKNISDRLNNVRLIDRFEIRAGLDRTLQIKLTTQIPAYVVSDQNGRSFLVGHLFRVMKEKTEDGTMPNLVRVQFNQFVSLKPLHSLRSGLSSASEFQDDFKRSFPKFQIRNLAWDPHEGVSAKIGFLQNIQTDDQTLGQSSSTKIVVGFPPYNAKLSQLRNILEDSNHKGIQLEAIDFNFLGKAVLKISDAKIGTKNTQ